MNEKHNIYTLTITTPNGVIEIPIQHRAANANDDNMQITIVVTIQGKKMCFDAETTEEVLTKFAKSLPVGWRIQSCLSCRYGQLCPVGNTDNELFCVTEFEPKEIRDLWHVTEDDGERKKRSRNLFNLCDQYMPQTSTYFTYSNYCSEMRNYQNTTP